MEILVIDDEQAMPSLFAQRFKFEVKRGLLSFHFVRSSEEALEFLERNKESRGLMVLSDIELPDGMNGLELLRNLKESRPDLPVFIVTAYDDEYNVRKATAYGANEFIRKPIDFEKLRQKLMDCIKATEKKPQTI